MPGKIESPCIQPEPMSLTFTLADQADTPTLAALRNATAEALTERFGLGPWTQAPPFDLRNGRVFVARNDGLIVGHIRLQTKKPWAIDVSYFTPVSRALYITGLAVDPSVQRQGIGRMLILEAVRQMRAFPAQALRLDAWDHAAGAGPFYIKCGFTDRGRVTYRKAPLIYFELIS